MCLPTYTTRFSSYITVCTPTMTIMRLQALHCIAYTKPYKPKQHYISFQERKRLERALISVKVKKKRKKSRKQKNKEKKAVGGAICNLTYFLYFYTIYTHHQTHGIHIRATCSQDRETRRRRRGKDKEDETIRGYLQPLS